MGGFSGASPYRRSASVVPSPSRRFAWRCVAFVRSEEHTSELQSLMRISYAVFCLKKKLNWHCGRSYEPTTQLNSLMHNSQTRLCLIQHSDLQTKQTKTLRDI